MTPREAYAYLLALPRFEQQGAAAYRPGLERIEALLEGMNRPDRAFPSVHVGGTNGKGSTASMIAAVATAAGRRTGLHTSPHLYDFAERLRIDGVPAPKTWIAAETTRFKDLFDEIRPTFFEIAVALSLLYFAEAAVDLAVVEVGMGGRLDATNVLRPRLSVITSIGLDHTEHLGSTLPEIAREKAGIVKPETPLVTAVHQPEILALLRERARRCGAPFHPVVEEMTVSLTGADAQGLALDVESPVRAYPELQIGLPGRHQAMNALTAVRTAELLLPDLAHEDAPLREGLRRVRRLSGLRGRLDVLQQEPFVVVDVAHNADGLRTALSFMQEMLRPRQGHLFVLFGAMRDKDVAEMCSLLADARALVLPVAPPSERALPASDLRTLLENRGIPIIDQSNVPDSLDWFLRNGRAQDGLLIAGSHFVAAQVPEHLTGSLS